MQYKLDFYTQYNQFYISSDNGSVLLSNSMNWSETAYHDRLFLLKNMVVVFTGSYGHVRGEVDVLANSNHVIDFDKYDHIVEGGIEVRSGMLHILDCPNSLVELKIKIKPGSYRIRIYSSNLVNTDIDEYEGNDYYKIEIWPDTNMERKVLKQYNK